MSDGRQQFVAGWLTADQAPNSSLTRSRYDAWRNEVEPAGPQQRRWRRRAAFLPRRQPRSPSRCVSFPPLITARPRPFPIPKAPSSPRRRRGARQRKTNRSALSKSRCRKRRSMTFAGALLLRDGPTRKPSPISRRARSWRSCRQLVRYWGSGYDWRKAEAKLNALPQFVTNIDGVDIHFIHVRSRHKNALPVIITHGWPGSVIEQLKIIGRSRIQPRTEAAPRTRSTSSSRPYQATASPASRRAPAGTPITSREPGPS